jgi:hypothetical protein
MIKRLSSLMLFAGVVLFSYAAANAQNTPAPPTQPTTASNPRVVITDNLAKPAMPAAASTATTPKTTTQSYGNHNVTVTEGVTGINLENGKYLTVTKWDGTKWVTKREWVANAPKPNP